MATLHRSGMMARTKAPLPTGVAAVSRHPFSIRPAKRGALMVANAEAARRSILFGTVASATALTEVANPFPSQAASSDTVGKAVAEAYQDFATGDIANCLKKFSPNITFTPAKLPVAYRSHAYRGLGELLEFFKQLDQSDQVTKFEPIQIVAEGNKAIGVVNYSVKVRSTGREYSTVLTHIFTVDDKGLFVGFDEYATDLPSVYAAYQA